MELATLLLQAVLVFAVAFIYANLGLGGGLLFVPILLSTGIPSKDVAVPVSLTLTIATAGSLSYFCRIHPAMVGTLNVTP